MAALTMRLSSCTCIWRICEANVSAIDLPCPDGRIDPGELASALQIDRATLANLAGLSRDAIPKSARLSSRATQKRLAEITEIISRVAPWAGSPRQALAWYRAQSIPSFGDLTPQDLVVSGRANDLKTYLSRIAEGGYA